MPQPYHAAAPFLGVASPVRGEPVRGEPATCLLCAAAICDVCNVCGWWPCQVVHKQTRFVTIICAWASDR